MLVGESQAHDGKFAGEDTALGFARGGLMIGCPQTGAFGETHRLA